VSYLAQGERLPSFLLPDTSGVPLCRQEFRSLVRRSPLASPSSSKGISSEGSTTIWHGLHLEKGGLSYHQLRKLTACLDAAPPCKFATEGRANPAELGCGRLWPIRITSNR
jgi:hypothetical protein